MSTKLLEATCSAAGVVTAEGVSVPEAVVLSEGKKASTGFLLIEADKAKYVTSSATDIKDLIGRVNAIVEKLILITTSLDAVTVTPGTAAANIALLTTLNSDLLATQELLK